MASSPYPRPKRQSGFTSTKSPDLRFRTSLTESGTSQVELQSYEQRR